MIEYLLKSANYWSLERLVSFRSAAKFLLVISLLAAFFFANLFPTELVIQNGSEKLTVSRNVLVVIFSPLVFLFLIAVWWMTRRVYWWSGSGHRIAISCEVYRTSIEDWVSTRKHLSQLLREKDLNQHLCIRLIPESVTATKEQMKSFCKKHDFHTVLMVEISASADRAGHPVTIFQLALRTSEPIYKDLMVALDKSRNTLFEAADEKSLKRQLAWQANSLLHLMLFSIGILRYLENDRRIAIKLLEALDGELSARVPKQHMPRALVRQIIVQSYVDPMKFSIRTIPESSKLSNHLEIFEYLEREYAEDFPQLLLGFGRLLFVMCESARAFEVIDAGLRSKNLAINHVSFLVSSGFLNLIHSKYDCAARDFESVFMNKEWIELDWEEITAFADFAVEYGYENAVYAQGFYRAITRKDGWKDYRSATLDWLNQDTSRKNLKRLYMKTTKGTMPLSSRAV